MIDIEMVGQARADTGNLSVASIALQTHAESVTPTSPPVFRRKTIAMLWVGLIRVFM